MDANQMSALCEDLPAASTDTAPCPLATSPTSTTSGSGSGSRPLPPFIPLYKAPAPKPPESAPEPSPEVLRLRGGAPGGIAKIWAKEKALKAADPGFKRLLNNLSAGGYIKKFSNTICKNDDLDIHFYSLVVIDLINYGGLYGGVKDKSLYFQVEANHMPPKAVAKKLVPSLSEADMPAVTMAYRDHRIFPSTGAGPVSDKAKNALKDLRLQNIKTVEQYHAHLVKSGSYANAMEIEIRVKRKMFGTKYKKGIDEAIDAAAGDAAAGKAALITPGEANKLKIINQ